jgi:hypothetical protein
MRLSQLFFHFWKHCSKDVCGIAFKSYVALVMLFSPVWNRFPLRAIFSLGNTEELGVGDELSRGFVEG